MTLKKQKCALCVFARAAWDAPDHRKCNRYAPRPLVGVASEWPGAEADWPTVSVNDWCGEFQPRIGLK